MSRTLLAALAALVLTPPAWAAPAPAPRPAAAEPPIPGKTLVAVQVQGHGRVRDRLKAMLQKAVPDLAPGLAAKIDAALADGLKGWNLEPLRADGRLAVAFLAFEGNEPEAVGLLPLNDFAAFRSKVLPPEARKSYEKGRRFDTFDASDEKTLYVADLTKDGYVAVATTQEAAEAVVNGAGRLNAAAMGPAAAELFLGSDVGVYVHMERINEIYGERLRQFRQLFQALIQQGAMAGAGLDERQMGMARQLYDGMFQAVEDAQGFAVGLDFRPEGAALKMAMAFAGDTASRTLLADEKPTDLPRLADAPAGQGSYTAGQFGPKLTAASMFLAQMLSPGDDEKAAKLFAEYVEKSSHSRDTVVAGTPPEVTFSASTPADPKAVIEAQLRLMKALDAGMRYQNIPLKEKPTVADGTRPAGRFALHEVRLRLDFDAAAEKFPNGPGREAMVAALKRGLPETLAVWFGTDGQETVQVMAPDWAAAEALVSGYAARTNGVGSAPAFRATRNQLPKLATLVTLIDVGWTITVAGASIADVAGKIPGLPIGNLPPLAPAPATVAYLGVGVVLRPAEARFELFVPAAAAGIARTMVQPMIDAARQAKE